MFEALKRLFGKKTVNHPNNDGRAPRPIPATPTRVKGYDAPKPPPGRAVSSNMRRDDGYLMDPMHPASPMYGSDWPRSEMAETPRTHTSECESHSRHYETSPSYDGGSSYSPSDCGSPSSDSGGGSCGGCD